MLNQQDAISSDRWLLSEVGDKQLNHWRAEVLQSLIDREKRVLPAHLVAFVTLALAVLFVSKPIILMFALTARVLSLALTRWCVSRLHQALKCSGDVRKHVVHLCFAMIVSGASWASFLLSLDVYLDPAPARIAIAGVVLIGVTLVIITFGSISEALGTFVTSFLGFVAFGNWLTNSPLPWLAFAVLLPLIVGPVLFSFGAARTAKAEAKLVISNRKLSAKLMVALEKAQFLAQHDPLTGLANRRAFFAEYDVDLDTGDTRSFLLIDLDKFKAINDHFGHENGDQVLRAVALEMRDILGGLPSGRHKAVRLGGDEFAIVLDRVNRHTAEIIAEAMRERIKNIPQRFNLDRRIQVSASIGCAQQSPDESLTEVLRRTDMAMYSSKEEGRNQVTMAA